MCFSLHIWLASSLVKSNGVPWPQDTAHSLHKCDSYSNHCLMPPSPRLLPSVCLQSDVWEADLWDSQLLPPPLPGQPVCMFPDARTCVFCHGVYGRGRPHDAHTCRRLFWATCCVSSASMCACSWKAPCSVCLPNHGTCSVYVTSCLSIVYPTGSTLHVWSWVCSSFMTIRLCTGESLDRLSLFSLPSKLSV